MRIYIVLPYEGAVVQYKFWANEEKSIDFRKEPKRAERCTVCFAATELEQYLTRLGFEAFVGAPSDGGFRIDLQVGSEGMCPKDAVDLTGQEFTFRKQGQTLVIRGAGRAGVLYGVYEFLRNQGIYWLSPWEEVLPDKILLEAEHLVFPEEKFYRPAFPMGRGFEFEGPLKDSEKLYLWMARNKLNLSTYRYQTAAFQKKLGMIFKQGGHIFEGLLHPDNTAPTRRSFWEEYPEWYGLPADRMRRKEKAQATQFCMSNVQLLEYLGEKLVERLQGEWYHADRIDVWGFDTWGSTCQCERCKSLGNSSDQSLYFMSYLRNHLDRACGDGRLDRRVNLVVVAYEGTCNLKAPLNPVPENLRNSGDYISYAPIVRCFEHPFADESCAYNKYYNKHLKDWTETDGGISLGINEYYNVSKFEDLPFLFTETIFDDIRYYHEVGVQCMTYMHLPMLLWGVRNLTQIQYARLCWDAQTDGQELLKEYFEKRYGDHAQAMQKAYGLIERAGKNCSSWRAWCQKSVLSNLQSWGGGKPEQPLFRDNHLEDDTVGKGLLAVSQYEEAIRILEEEKEKADLMYLGKMKFSTKLAVNPADTRFREASNAYGNRIMEDLISVRYGRDCMELITLFVAYHETLEQEQETGELWEKIEILCKKMMGYYVPIAYNNPDTDLNCLDALTRCQLRDLYYRCRAKKVVESHCR